MSRLARLSAPRMALAGALAVAGVTACDGPNQFSTPLPTGTGPDAAAPVVEIRVPRSDEITAKPLGDSIEVQAFVDDDQGIDSVLFVGLELRGDPSLGTDEEVIRYAPKTVQLNQARDTVVRRFLLPTEDRTRDTARVFVQAWDVAGNSTLDSVRVILGGPDVVLLNLEDGQSVQSGLALSLQVRAYDPTGLNQISFELEGVVDQVLTRSLQSRTDTVRFDTIVPIPAVDEGTLRVTARARNVGGLQGVDGPVELDVVEGGGGDVTAPTPRLSAAAESFLELQDSVLVTVSGADDDQGTGISIVGYTVVATSAARGDTLVSDSVVFPSPRTGTVSRTFMVPVAKVDSLSLPDTLTYEVTGFLVDASGNCAAAVDASGASFDCGSRDGAVVAQNRDGLEVEFAVVAGRTVQLPRGGTIMDAVVDTVRRNLMMSNIDRGTVEVFRLQSETFLTPVDVGAEPWGLALNRPPGRAHADTLLVANSGGTNISSIYLGPDDGTGPFVEDANRRLLTPDVVLFDIETVLDDAGFLRYNGFFIPDAEPPGFSDNPQFIAVDSTGRRLYSTRTTLLGDFGTIRKTFIPEGADPGDPDVRPETKLFFEHGALEENPDFTAVGNIDDITIFRGSTGDQILLTDHVPGFPDRTITGGPALLPEALGQLAAQGSDVLAGSGRFVVPNLGFTDTTFVSSSGDGGWVVFGEGAIAPVGRVIMYNAAEDSISGVVTVADLLNNESETVAGIGLNFDGTLGVARGSEAYFFTTDLRLQGSAGLPAGGAGAVLHPLHADARSIANPGGEYRPDTHLAFLGTGERTIDIVDTFFFKLLGRIYIRDVMTGPLRAVLPFPEDNQGFQCTTTPVTDQENNFIGEAVEIFAGGNYQQPHPANGATPTEDRCIVLKLFGISDSGGVVVVDVRKGDILRNHPARVGN